MQEKQERAKGNKGMAANSDNFCQENNSFPGNPAQWNLLTFIHWSEHRYMTALEKNHVSDSKEDGAEGYWVGITSVCLFTQCFLVNFYICTYKISLSLNINDICSRYCFATYFLLSICYVSNLLSFILEIRFSLCYA